MLKRLIDSVIDNHYASTKKALLLTGARQIGKTYAPRDYSLLGRVYYFPASDWNTGDYTIYISSIGYTYQGYFEIY